MNTAEIRYQPDAADRTRPYYQALDDLTRAGQPVRSYKAGMLVSGEQTYSFNAVRFATVAEARIAGSDLMGRWLAVTDYLVFPSADAPNYQIVDGVLSHIEGAD